jgi:hypothetical protein
VKTVVMGALLPFDRRLVFVRAPVERVLRTTGALVMRWLDARRDRTNDR